MTDPRLARDILELSAIWHDVIRLQPRWKAMLPANLVRAHKRFRVMHSVAKTKRMPDYPFFYRAGIVFSRQDRPLTMGEISDALGIPLSTATRIVDWFVGVGYAERMPDAQDRRIVRVALTRSGKEVFQEMDRFIRQQVELMLKQFTPKERKALITLLQKMVRVLEESVQ